MYRTSVALLLACMLSSSIFAQTANRYDGTWKIKFDGPTTANLGGAVVIKEDGGTWNQDAGVARNACFKREAPIAVELATAEELVFKVNRSKVLAGCPDSTMKFKKVDDRTLKGEFPDGRVLTLTRE
ncbi:MAG: hypothetical protein ABJA83_07085 [Burkholderiaceae bacterium]